MLLKGYSQLSSCEHVTTTTFSGPLGTDSISPSQWGWVWGWWAGGCGLVLRGSLPVRSFARRPYLLGKGGPLAVTMRVPKFSTLSALPHSVRGGTSSAMCKTAARVRRVVRWGWYLSGSVSVGCGGGGGQQKVCSLCFLVLNRDPAHNLHPCFAVAEIWGFGGVFGVGGWLGP